MKCTVCGIERRENMVDLYIGSHEHVLGTQVGTEKCGKIIWGECIGYLFKSRRYQVKIDGKVYQTDRIYKYYKC